MKTVSGILGIVLAAGLACALPAWAQQAAPAATPPAATAPATTPAAAADAPKARTAGAEYLAQGDQLVAAKDYNKAVAKYVMAWLEMPDNPAVVDRLGDLYVANSRDADATRFYAAAIKMNPGFEDPIIGLAQAYLRLSHPEQALSLLADPARRETFAQSARFRHTLGLAYLRAAKYPEATTELLEASKLAPKQGSFYGDLGNAYFMQKRYPDALVAYDKALALQPKDTVAALNRSYAQERLGRFTDAIASLELHLKLANATEDNPQRKRLVELKSKVLSPPATGK